MADTYELDPTVRIEEILNGDDIEPANRLEYFLQKAATEVPKPSSADAGSALIVDANGVYQLENPDNYVLNPVPPMVLTALSSDTLLIHDTSNFYPCAAVRGGYYDSDNNRIRVKGVMCARSRKTDKMRVYRIAVPGNISTELTIDNEQTQQLSYDIVAATYGYTANIILNIANVNPDSDITYRIGVEELDADNNRISDIMYSDQIVFHVDSTGVASISAYYQFNGSYTDKKPRHITGLYLGKYRSNGTSWDKIPLGSSYDMSTVTLTAGEKYTVIAEISPKAAAVHLQEFNT